MPQRHCARYRERLVSRTESDNHKREKRKTPADKTEKADQKKTGWSVQQQDQEESK